MFQHRLSFLFPQILFYLLWTNGVLDKQQLNLDKVHKVTSDTLT